MSLPTVQKTWQYNVNQLVTSQGSALATNRRVFRSIKDALKGFASGAWTVVGSSNGVTANMTGTDLWVTDADLVFSQSGGAVARSWIVLKQLGMSSSGIELLITLDANNTARGQGGYGGNAYLAETAAGGFTGGSTTANPTATGQIQLITLDLTGITTDIPVRWNVMQAADGSGTRFWTYAAGTIRMLCIIDKPIDVVSAWLNPFVAAWFNSAANTTLAISMGYTWWTSRINGLQSAIALGTEGAGGATALPSDTVCGAIPNDLTNEYVMVPCNICSNTNTRRGRHGVFPDLWYRSTGTVDGDTYPGDGSATFINVGPFIFPWNGGSVNLT